MKKKKFNLNVVSWLILVFIFLLLLVKNFLDMRWLKENYISILNVFFGILSAMVCLLFLILSLKLFKQEPTNSDGIKITFYNVLTEFSCTNISVKTFLFFFSSILMSLIFFYNNFFRFSVTMFFFGILLLFREIKFVKDWLSKMRKEDFKIKMIYWEKYKFFYVFNLSIKFFCFLYFFYFVFSLDFDFLLENKSFEKVISYVAQATEPLYATFLVFLNSIVVDLIVDLFIMLTEADQLVLSGGQLLRRGTKTAIMVVGTTGVVGSVVSISPAVELPGVNEFQIHLGRGYGYKTPLDWGKGTIMNSYIDKAEMQDLSKKYGNNYILDGNSFEQILKHEKEVANKLTQKSTPWEQRFMGLRKF